MGLCLARGSCVVQPLAAVPKSFLAPVLVFAGTLAARAACSGFTACLHALVSAGLRVVETSDLFALGVIVVEGQRVIGFLTLMNGRSMLALGFNVLWINEPF